MAIVYKVLLTDVGANKLATSNLHLVEMALGDGNGEEYQPKTDQTALKKEVYRAKLSNCTIEDNRIKMQLNVPASAPAFSVREVGVFDDANKLIFIANTPTRVKPSDEQGATVDSVISIVAYITGTDKISFTIDGSSYVTHDEMTHEINNAIGNGGNNVNPPTLLTTNNYFQQVTDNILITNLDNTKINLLDTSTPDLKLNRVALTIANLSTSDCIAQGSGFMQFSVSGDSTSGGNFAFNQQNITKFLGGIISNNKFIASDNNASFETLNYSATEQFTGFDAYLSIRPQQRNFDQDSTLTNLKVTTNVADFLQVGQSIWVGDDESVDKVTLEDVSIKTNSFSQESDMQPYIFSDNNIIFYLPISKSLFRGTLASENASFLCALDRELIDYYDLIKVVKLNDFYYVHYAKIDSTSAISVTKDFSTFKKLDAPWSSSESIVDICASKSYIIALLSSGGIYKISCSTLLNFEISYYRNVSPGNGVYNVAKSQSHYDEVNDFVVFTATDKRNLFSSYNDVIALELNTDKYYYLANGVLWNAVIVTNFKNPYNSLVSIVFFSDLYVGGFSFIYIIFSGSTPAWYPLRFELNMGIIIESISSHAVGLDGAIVFFNTIENATKSTDNFLKWSYPIDATKNNSYMIGTFPELTSYNYFRLDNISSFNSKILYGSKQNIGVIYNFNDSTNEFKQSVKVCQYSYYTYTIVSPSFDKMPTWFNFATEKLSYNVNGMTNQDWQILDDKNATYSYHGDSQYISVKYPHLEVEASQIQLQVSDLQAADVVDKIGVDLALAESQTVNGLSSFAIEAKTTCLLIPTKYGWLAN